MSLHRSVYFCLGTAPAVKTTSVLVQTTTPAAIQHLNVVIRDLLEHKDDPVRSLV